MTKILLAVFFLLSQFASHAKLMTWPTDSPATQFHFHMGVSMQPVIHWFNKIDSTGHFFLSPVKYEVQVSCKKHFLVFGFNYKQYKNDFMINNLPHQKLFKRYSIQPSYQYRIHEIKKWTLFAGMAFTYNYTLDDYWIITPLELITKTTTIKSTGFAPYLRFNYRLNKTVSIETETAYYFSRTRYRYSENYPLTPSLGERSYSTNRQTTFSIPSNVLIKFSF